MNERRMLDACPFCTADLSGIQAAMLLDAGAVPKEINADHSKGEILARARQLEQLLSSLDQFSHRTSHDLREPVRKIVSFGDLLEYELGQDLSADARDYLDSMKRAATRLGGLIDGLLEYSRAASFDPEITEVDLNRLVQGLKGEYGERIHATGAYFSLGFLPTVTADRQQVVRILREFLDNAFAFHNPRRKSLILEIWAVLGRDPSEFSLEPGFMGRDMSPVEPAHARYCLISVRDNGKGFSPLEQEKIFEPYTKLGQHRENDGPGLGLAVCRRIADALGGRISAVGHLDKGATFSLLLPINQKTR